jgi:hypothetical protein
MTKPIAITALASSVLIAGAMAYFFFGGNRRAPTGSVSTFAGSAQSKNQARREAPTFHPGTADSTARLVKSTSAVAAPLHETPRLPVSFDELPDTPAVKQRLERADARGPQFLPMAKYSLEMYAQLSRCMRDRGVVPVDGSVEVSLQWDIDSGDQRHASISEAPVERSTLSAADNEAFSDCFKSVNIGQGIALQRPMNGRGFEDHEAIVFPIEQNYIYNVFRDNGMWQYPVKMPDLSGSSSK